MRKDLSTRGTGVAARECSMGLAHADSYVRAPGALGQRRPTLPHGPADRNVRAPGIEFRARWALRRGGFSLVEVLVAILILGLGLAGLMHGVTTALSASKETEQQTTAALMAVGRIELLRAEGYLTEGTEEGEGKDGLAIYRWRQVATGAGLEGLYEVTVAIEQAKTGKLVYELKTLLFDPPSTSVLSESQAQREREVSRRERRQR